MTKGSNKKFIFGIPMRAIKIVGLILLVAAQAYPLGAFESHIVSVTAIIDPPPLESPAGQNLAMDLSAAAGAQISVDDTTPPATDEPAGTSLDEEIKDDSGASDATVLEEPRAAIDETAGAENIDAVQNNEAVSESADQGADSQAPQDTSGQSESLTIKIEIVSADEQLVIENSGAFGVSE